MQGFGDFGQVLSVLLDFTDEMISSFFQTPDIFECLDCQVSSLGCNGECRPGVVMIGSRQEGCTCLHIGQRRELKIGESIWLNRRAPGDNLCTSAHRG